MDGRGVVGFWECRDDGSVEIRSNQFNRLLEGRLGGTMGHSRINGLKNLKCSLLIAAVTLSGVLVSPVLGQLPISQLTTLTPPGAKQGTELEVTVGGGDLDNNSQLIFSHPGINATAKTTPAGEFDEAPALVGNVYIVTIDAGVPPGVYDARVAGDFGLSNPRSFAVGTKDEVKDSGSNHSLKDAQLVPVGTTINGVADANNRDYYKFAVTAGQRVVLQAAGESIDSRLDGTLVLFNAEGQELANNRDSIGLDPRIDYTFKTEGEYTVEIHDFVYRGGGEYQYRLTLDSSPRVDYVFPPVGTIGSTQAYTVYGTNLAGGEPAEGVILSGAVMDKVTAQITLPAADALELRRHPSAIWDGSFSYRHEGLSPFFISATDLPVVVEKEGNNDAASATVVTVPCVVAGQFYPAGDLDWIEFEAKKGDVFQLELYSQRLGILSDPVLLLQRVTTDEEGKETVAEVARVESPGDRNGKIGTDFDTSTDDPSYRLVVNDDGRYRVLVQDQIGGARSDPRITYQLRIRPEKPDFRILAQPKQIKVKDGNEVKMFSPVVRRGGTMLIDVRIDRLEGFSGEIQFAVEGLPEGVTCDGAMVTSQGTASLVFQAADDAASWIGEIKIIGTAEINGEPVARTARCLTVVWATANRTQTAAYFRTTQGVWLSVIAGENEPALVKVGDSQVLETSKGGTLEIPITVTRRDGVGGDIKLVATGLPGEVKPGDVTIKGDATEGKLTMTITNAKAQAGLYTYYLRGDAKVKRPRNGAAIALAQANQSRIAELKTKTDEELKVATELRDKAEGDDKLKAEEELKVVQEKVTRVDAAKAAADKRLADTQKANAPKDTDFAVVSTPIRVRIVETPLVVTLAQADFAVKAAETVQVPVTIERKYGFAEAVELTVMLPGGVAGVSAATLTIAKDQSEGTLEFITTDKATVGEHAVTVQAGGTFNKIKVTANGQLKLKVEPAAAGS
jgi:hypothetical protein